jgi:hypothetical protein
MTRTMSAPDSGRTLPDPQYDGGDAKTLAALAALFGTGNQLGGVVTEVAGRLVIVNTEIGPVEAMQPGDAVDGGQGLAEGEAATLVWRFESGRLVQREPGETAAGRLAGVVAESSSVGVARESTVAVGDRSFRFRGDAGATLPRGTDVWLELDRQAVCAFPDNLTSTHG